MILIGRIGKCLQFSQNFKQTSQILRQTVATLTTTTTKVDDKDKLWSPIYKFPLISWMAALNKLKIYQATLTTIGIPISWSLETAEYLAPNSTVIFSTLGISGVITLCLTSLITKNLIGFIYINETMDRIKCSYIDFWGQRQNIELNIHEIVPFYEIPIQKWQFYQTVTTNSSIKLKLIYKFGKFIDPEIFTHVFGE